MRLHSSQHSSRPRARSAIWPSALLALVTVACAPPTDQGSANATLEPIGAITVSESAVFANASTPNLAAGPDGTVYLSFTERVDSSSNALRVAARSQGTWSAPQDIVRGHPLFVNWADFPSVVVLENGDLAAHWLEREGEGTYAYGVRVARSRDAGRTWSAGVAPHTDGLLAEHGFVSLWAAGGDQVGAVWLDGRKSAMPDSAREMTLRTTVLGREGVAVPEQLLDSRICDCCQTASAATRRGRVVVYRDRSSEEIRDIAIVRESAGSWSAPSLVHADNWHFEACPVNGPSVAALGDTVAVAWFTGAQDTARVRLAMSTDGGETFGPPVRIDEGDPLGRVTVLLDDAAQPVVLWMERTTSDSSAVRVRRVSGSGELSPATTVTTVAGSRRSGFPRMLRNANELLFAWTVPGDTTRVRIGAALIP
jgi:hypothetical protein